MEFALTRGLWLMCLAAICGLIPLHGQAPVLAWSARVGAGIEDISGTAVAPDGSVFVAARTQEAGKFGVYVAKLSADGARLECSMAVTEGTNVLSLVMALDSDGNVVLAGQGAVPRLPVVAPPPGVSQPSFLARVSVCDKRMVVSIGITDIWVTSLAMAANGDAYLAGEELTRAGGGGVVVRVNSARGVVARSPVMSGRPLAILVDDATGKAYVTGETVPRLGFVTRLSADLQTTEYWTFHSAGGEMSGQALAVGPGGLAEGIWAGMVGYGLDQFGRARVLQTWLVRLRPDGGVALARSVGALSRVTGKVAALKVSESDGRIWVGGSGLASIPKFLGLRTQVDCDCASLTAFAQDGSPVGGSVFLPGEEDQKTQSRFGTIAFGRGGRMVLTLAGSGIPVTPGAAGRDLTTGISVVVLDQPTGDEPVVTADREVMYMDTAEWDQTVEQTPKTTELWVSDSSERPFGAGITGKVDCGWEVAGEMLPSRVRAGIQTSREFCSAGRFLMILAPGTRGVLAIPILGQRPVSVTPRAALVEPVVLDAPTDEKVSIRLAVTADAGLPSGIRMRVPFRLEWSAPWLQLESTEGVTPMEIRGTIDPRGLGAGGYNASLDLIVMWADGREWRMRYPVSFRVDAGLIVSGVASRYGVRADRPIFCHTFQVTSTGRPLEVQLRTGPGPEILVSPSSGTTPLEVTVTVDLTQWASRFNPGPYVGEVGVSGASSGFLFFPRYDLVSPYSTGRADGVDATAAPGGLINWSGLSSRCEEAAAKPGEAWPTQLGGCQIALLSGGRPLPIGKVTANELRDGSGISLSYQVQAQLPWDLEPGPATLTITDSLGVMRSLPTQILSAAPRLVGVEDRIRALNLVRRRGEEVLIRLTGLGKVDGVGPWGEPATGPLAPLIPVEVFVGGRSALVKSVWLSRTEVGVVDVRVEVPGLAPDGYPISVLAGTTHLDGGTLVVSPE